MSFWRLPVHPHPNRLEGEQDPVLCEQCCELCVRSYIHSVVMVVVQLVQSQEPTQESLTTYPQIWGVGSC